MDGIRIRLSIYIISESPIPFSITMIVLLQQKLQNYQKDMYTTSTISVFFPNIVVEIFNSHAVEKSFPNYKN